MKINSDLFVKNKFIVGHHFKKSNERLGDRNKTYGLS